MKCLQSNSSPKSGKFIALLSCVTSLLKAKGMKTHLLWVLLVLLAVFSSFVLANNNEPNGKEDDTMMTAFIM